MSRSDELRVADILEAANAISDDFQVSHPEVPWRHVVNLRHLLAHHYHLDGRHLL